MICAWLKCELTLSICCPRDFWVLFYLQWWRGILSIRKSIELSQWEGLLTLFSINNRGNMNCCRLWFLFCPFMLLYSFSQINTLPAAEEQPVGSAILKPIHRLPCNHFNPAGKMAISFGYFWNMTLIQPFGAPLGRLKLCPTLWGSPRRRSP